MKYAKDDDLKKIAENLIWNLNDPYMAQIKTADPAIAYRSCDAEKKSNGMIVHAECEKVKPSNKQYMAYDYIITLYPNNCLHMSDKQIEVLMYHELLHIDCRRDDDGVLSCKLRPHDIQEFSAITGMYGEDWSEDGKNIESIFERVLKR